MIHPRVLILALLVGCASAPPISMEQRRVEVDSYVVLAELALERQAREEATQLFLDAALVSDDPILAERAARMADELGLTEIGLQAVGRWRELAPEDDRPTWFFGIFQMRAARYDDATASFLRLIEQLPPENHGAVLALIMEALAAEPNPAAGTFIMTALADHLPDLPEARYALARLAFRSGDFELALENAEVAAELEPDWPDAQLLYARTLLVAGRTSDSLALGRELVDRLPSVEVQLQYAELLLSAGQGEEAKLILGDLLADNPELIEATRALAFLALTEDELDAAESYFEQLRGNVAYRDETFYYLGRIAEAKGDQLQATRSYSRVTEGTHAIEAQLRTARIMFDQTGDPEVPLQHLAEFGNASPRFAADMLVARAQILVQMERSDEAMQLVDEALSAAPSDATLQTAQVDLYITFSNEATNRDDLDEAERLLAEGLDKHPDHVSIRYAQALLYENKGRMRKAARVLQNLADEQPDNAAILNAYGYLLTDEFNRHDEAHDYIRRALAMDPDNAAIIDSMGWVLYHLGDYAAALDYLERAARLVTDPEMFAHLVDVHWILGDQARALELLDSSLSDFPDSRHLIEVDQRLRQ